MKLGEGSVEVVALRKIVLRKTWEFKAKRFGEFLLYSKSRVNPVCFTGAHFSVETHASCRSRF